MNTRNWPSKLKRTEYLEDITVMLALFATLKLCKNAKKPAHQEAPDTHRSVCSYFIFVILIYFLF